MNLVIPAFRMLSNTGNKYLRCGLVSGRWCIFLVNVASGGICSQKLTKSTGFTSRTDSTKTSANSATSACAWFRCSSVS